MNSRALADLAPPLVFGVVLLAGSYYGQTVQIWAALFTAAALSGVLVAAIGLAGRITLKRMAFPQ